MQAPPNVEPLGDLVVRFGGITAVLLWAAFWGIRLWRHITEGRKAAATGEPVGAAHIDLVLTEHFDQLRRDLTTTIERAHAHTQKETVDAMQRFLLELELIVKGVNDRRRPRP